MKQQLGVSPFLGARLIYVACALMTIVIGLAVHLGGRILPHAIRDVMGDALWAVMITWWVSAVWPRQRAGARAAIALVICYAVEFSQLHHTPALDAFRRTNFGHLLLGSGFHPRDLLAYALGVAAAALLDRAARRPHTSTT